MSDSTAPNVVGKYRTEIKAGKGEVSLADIQAGDIKSLQARAGIDRQTVDDYAALMAGSRGRGNAAAEFPSVRIWQVKDALYLTAGSHRWRAAKAANKDSIDAEFFTGTYAEALVDAITSNARHGRRPTSDDIRHSLELLFEQGKKYQDMTDRSLSKLIGCSATTIGKVRGSLSTVDSDSRKRVDKNGRQIDTTKIGKKPKKKPAPLSNLESDKAKLVAGLVAGLQSISKSDGSDDEPPLCVVCEVRDAVDHCRCQQCIDADRRPEPEVIDDGEEDDSDAADTMRAWNKAIESIARYLGKLDDGLAVLGKSPWLDADRLGRVEKHVAAVITELRAIKGYKTCPKCCGADGGCEFCRREGFVTRAVFDSLETGE